MTSPPDEMGHDPPAAPEPWEEIVAGVLAGDIPADDPRVGALPAAARARLEELGRMQQLLAADAARERELLAEVDRHAANTGSPDVDRFLASVTAPVAAQPSGEARPSSEAQPPSEAKPIVVMRPRRPTVQLLGWLALAAGIVLVVQGAREVFGTRHEDPGSRGSGELGGRPRATAIQPLRDLHDLRLFRWTGELREGDRFVLHVWAHDLAQPRGRGAEIASVKLTDHEWRPGPDTSLPARIVWRVDIEQRESDTIRGEEIEAWHQP